MSKWNPEGKLAVVTGASSGIGRSLCMLLSQAGCRVIAVARRKERLKELENEVAQRAGAAPLLLVCGDVTAESTRSEIEAAVRSLGTVDQGVSDQANAGKHVVSPLDLLVNNAGIGGIGPFEEASPDRLRQIMEVNFFAPAELTRTLLPYLRSSRDAVICNIGSVLGHRAVPDKSEYCASKFAMHGWSDALRSELSGTSVQVTLVSPSTTRSEFFDVLVDSDPASKSKSIGSWPPERVAAATLKAIRHRRAEVVLSAGGKLLVYADRLCPALMNWVLRTK